MTPTKVLIVEDDGTIIVRLEKLLQTWGLSSNLIFVTKTRFFQETWFLIVSNWYE